MSEEIIMQVSQEKSKKYHKEWNVAKFKTRTTTKKTPLGTWSARKE